MFVYTSIFSILSIFALATPRRAISQFLWGVCIFLIWFMGFRYEVGCDFSGYLNRWRDLPYTFDFRELIMSNEGGFKLLMATTKASGLEYIWLNVFASVIQVACYFIFAKNFRYSLLILALLFPVIIVQMGMSGIRQGIAIGFLMVAMTAFYKGKKLATALWILLGMQFHTSVVIFLPIAFLAGRTFNTWRLMAALLILGPVAATLVADRLELYTSRYIDQTHRVITSGGAIIRYALIFIPIPFFFLYRKTVEARFPDVYPLLNLFTLISISLFPLVFFSTIALERLNYYIMPGSILIFVYTGAVVFRRDQWILGHILAILAYGFYSLSWFLTSWHAQACYVPYTSTTFLPYMPLF